MTIEERILFLRAGYSAQDIAAFEAAEATDGEPAQAPDPAPEADPAPVPDPAPAPAPDPEQPAWAAALQKSIDGMTAALQASNRQFVDMGDPETAEQAADAALAEYLTGKVPEKSKSNGGRRK